MSSRDLTASTTGDVAHARIAAAIDRHVVATSTTLSQLLGEIVPSFAEPRTGDPTHALHVLDYLVETLLGVAAGAVLGRVVSMLLRSFGSDLTFALQLQLRDALVQIGPGSELHDLAARPSTAPAVPYLRDAAARPLVDELGVRLHPRLAHGGLEHRAVLTRISTAVPEHRVAAFTTTLGLLDRDPMLASIWSEHLQLAWRFYTAALASVQSEAPRLPPELAASAACQTWRDWLRRVRGESPPTPPAPAPVDHGQYVMAIG